MYTSLWVYCLLFVFACAAHAHEARPVSINIIETELNYFNVAMKVPNVLPENGLPHLAMPTNCTLVQQSALRRGTSSFNVRASYHCRQGLATQTLALAFPNNQASVNTLFRLRLLSGETFNHLLKPSQRQWQVPAQASRLAVAKDYSLLGIKHIFGGADHLLFVACLLFIAGSRKRMVITLSGFTLAHSLTLCLSVLGIVNIATAAVETLIALSIVFLAYEISTANPQSWTWRYPIAVSSSFGLLHGLGFAAVLNEIGLPPTELGTALLFFNLGVEVGQLAFIGMLLAVANGIPAKLINPLSRQTLVYCVGSVAAFWFISRLLAL